MKSDGTLWAWGWNEYGQLGDGTTTNKHSPVQIGTDNDWVFDAAGGSHTIAIKSDGTLWTWGWNHHGKLGDGTTTDRHYPTQIGTDTDWISGAAGTSHTVALKSDGTLWAWGNNGSGQLGDGTRFHRHFPDQVGTDTDWILVAAGGSHNVALKSDGTLWAWGLNHFGQVGVSTTTYGNPPFRMELEPVKLETDTDNDWISAAAGGGHTLTLKSDGTLWGWGDNRLGQLNALPTTEVCDGADNDLDGYIDEGFDDTDNDNSADCVDTDDDNDGVVDAFDPEPLNPVICGLDSDGDTCDDCAIGVDGFGPSADNDPAHDGPDTDGDGMCDAGDNCPQVFNPWQADIDVPPGMVSRWEFDEGAGTIVCDSADGNWGTVNGEATWTVDGALNFDGMDDYVEVADADNLDVSDVFTLSARIKTTSNGAIISKWSSCPDALNPIKGSSYQLGLGQGKAVLAINRGGNYTDKVGSLSGNNDQLNDGNFHVVSATFNNKEAKIYIDGALDSTGVFEIIPAECNQPDELCTCTENAQSGFSSQYICEKQLVRISWFDAPSQEFPENVSVEGAYIGEESLRIGSSWQYCSPAPPEGAPSIPFNGTIDDVTIYGRLVLETASSTLTGGGGVVSTGTPSSEDPVDATVTVPALGIDTTISITEYSATDPALDAQLPDNSLPRVFRFGPGGLPFNPLVPITIVFTYDDTAFQFSDEGSLKVHLLVGGNFIEVPDCAVPGVLGPDDPCVSERDINANTISVLTSHFSIYALSAEPNEPPVADAGQDQAVSAGTDCEAMVMLDGTGSDDPDSDSLSYTWSGSFGTVQAKCTPSQPTFGLG